MRVSYLSSPPPPPSVTPAVRSRLYPPPAVIHSPSFTHRPPSACRRRPSPPAFHRLHRPLPPPTPPPPPPSFSQHSVRSALSRRLPFVLLVRELGSTWSERPIPPGPKPAQLLVRTKPSRRSEPPKTPANGQLIGQRST